MWTQGGTFTGRWQVGIRGGELEAVAEKKREIATVGPTPSPHMEFVSELQEPISKSICETKYLHMVDFGHQEVSEPLEMWRSHC